MRLFHLFDRKEKEQPPREGKPAAEWEDLERIIQNIFAVQRQKRGRS